MGEEATQSPPASSVADATTVELLREAWGRIDTERETQRRGGDGLVAREFALAATSVEDAIMRTNLGFARKHGKLTAADVELATEHDRPF